METSVGQIDFGGKDYKIITGDSLQMLRELPDGSVNCCVTSPPYFNLRDYHVDGQIGMEKTPEEYIQSLVKIFREVRRVLRDDGTLWVNIGDSYCNSNGFMRKSKEWKRKGSDGAAANDRSLDALHETGLKTKDLIGIPWMLAFALRQDGWYLRQDIIWCLSDYTMLYVRSDDGNVSTMSLKNLLRQDLSRMSLWSGERWVRITGITESNDPGDRIEMVMSDGERIGTTANHVWLLEDGREVQARELKEGDRLMRRLLPDERRYYPSLLSKDLLWVVGLFLACGSFDRREICLYIGQEDADLLDEIQRIAELYGGKFNCWDDDATGGVNIRISSFAVCQAIRQCVYGDGVNDRRLSYTCWNLSNEDLSQLVDGYFDGIGCRSKKEASIRLPYIKNFCWHNDLRSLAARLGAHIELLWSKRESSSGKEYYKPSMSWNWDYDGASAGCEIVQIRKSTAEKFYDISVDSEDHLFSLASGIITHNCKPNPLPESVTDRCTKAHEYIFLLSKKEKYYFDHEAIEEEATGYDGRKDTLLKGSPKYAGNDVYPDGAVQTMAARGHQRWKFKEVVKPDMKNIQDMGRTIHSMHRNRAAGNRDEVYPVRRKRDVWSVPTKSYSGAHFATYPEKLIEPCILSGCPEGGVVLDIFNGAATTGVVALKHGRKYVGIELNPEYVELSEKRLDGRTDDDGTEYLF